MSLAGVVQASYPLPVKLEVWFNGREAIGAAQFADGTWEPVEEVRCEASDYPWVGGPWRLLTAPSLEIDLLTQKKVPFHGEGVAYMVPRLPFEVGP